MAFIADSVYDNGLSYASTNGTSFHICSSEPVAYGDVATFTLGNKTVVTGSPENGAVDGRRVQVPAIADGTVTGDGTAAFWALTDGIGEIIATGALQSTQTVTNGNVFTLDPTIVALRDANAV